MGFVFCCVEFEDCAIVMMMMMLSLGRRHGCLYTASIIHFMCDVQFYSVANELQISSTNFQIPQKPEALKRLTAA